MEVHDLKYSNIFFLGEISSILLQIYAFFLSWYYLLQNLDYPYSTRTDKCLLNNCRYASLYATSLLKKIREDGIYTRPLGNVIYLMCGPCTSPQVCSQIMNKLIRRLDEFSEVKNVGACQP